MKILQILPGLTLGGPTVSTTSLARHLQERGHEVQFHTIKKDFSVFPDLNFHPYSIPNLPYNGQFAFSFELYRNLKKECKDAQIIQTNSLWQFPCFIHEFARRGSNAKSIIVPRGTLSPYALSMSKLLKKIVLACGQRSALKNADMFIATCQKEYEDIRAFGLTQPVAVIPNGLYIPNIINNDKKKIVLYLGRIHKVKGIDVLIDAWKQIQKKKHFNDWNLIIAGPTNNEYADVLQTKAKPYDSIRFVGEINGEKKNKLMAESAIYTLPSHTENFGISVGEALACGTPVITTTGTPWAGLVKRNCGLWIDLSIDNVTCALEDMMSRSIEELTLMGQNGRIWIEKDFSWSSIAEKTEKAYEWLLNPNEVVKPDWVYCD